jgi:UDP-N-acetyl-D-mannosaminuronate dehydrogenase
VLGYARTHSGGRRINSRMGCVARVMRCWLRRIHVVDSRILVLGLAFRKTV